jgi:hypothetical protein
MKTLMRPLIALTATALAVAGCGGGGSGSSQSPNAPPTMSALADLAINQDTASTAVTFAVTDDRTAADSLTVSASSSDTNVIPAEGITLAGAGTNRSVMVTPLETAVGSSMVSLTVVDAAGLSTTRSFTVTVNAVNLPFTPWMFDMYSDVEGADSRSLLGFTLTNDSEDQPDAFDSLL